MESKKTKILPWPGLFLIYSIVFLILLFSYRILFVYTYRYRLPEDYFFPLLKAFGAGLRFDLSITFIVLFPFMLLSSIVFLNRFSLYRFLWSTFPAFLLWGAFIHLLADIEYYENANKHLGYEAFIFLGKDIWLLILSVTESKPFISLLFILFSIIYFISILKIFQKLSTALNYRKSKKEIGIFLLIVIPLSVLCIRGGTQTSFIRPSFSIVSDNTFINHIGLNGIFTTFYDFRTESIPNYHRMKLLESYEWVKKEIDYGGAKFISPAYPILRKTIVQKKFEKSPNIILVLLESWPAKYIQVEEGSGFIDGKEVCPEFNQIIKKGRYFKNFFATGGRTSNGLMATLTGLPDSPGLSSLHTQKAMSRFLGLGAVMQLAGYETMFLTGSNLGFENLGVHVKRWGFQEVLDERDIQKLNLYKAGIWGYHDADLYDLVLKKIEKRNSAKPLFSTVLTISTHYPFRSPDEKLDIFGSKVRDHDFLNVLHYADWAIGDFIRKAEKMGRLNDTIFIFLADHTHHRYLNYFEDRNIPFLIYAPSVLEPGLETKIGNQLDVIPTILGLAGLEVVFSALGKDLLYPNTASSAYFAFGNLFGWIEKDLFFAQNISENDKGISFPFTPLSGEPKDLCSKEILRCKEYQYKSRAFLNLTEELLKKNIVAP
ncbi:MAG: sulfatase-like hydrolase/transferase [Leptospiraceae bacterium]|nr:sulfatase-like hydrolase/transferase [Leptospiraceae bacterium]MCP5499898.1 sulfatase-like hydrolase/transferase [Leptospiraceae bacterium]